MSAHRPITIYDTGVLVQATLSPDGVAERALQWAEGDDVEAIINHHLRWEYERVLVDLAKSGKYPQLSQPDIITAQLERVDAVMLLVPNAPRQVSYRRDPEDEQTIDLALYTQAAFVVARDKDLLALNNDPEFRRSCQHTRVVNPFEFVREMERRRELGAGAG